MKALKIENMSWWLSILLILAGTLLFLIVYALMQGLSSVFSNDIVAVIAGFALGGVTLALYALYGISWRRGRSSASWSTTTAP